MAEEMEEKQAKKGNSFILIIIIIVLVLLLVIGGLIAYLVLSGNDQPNSMQDGQTQGQMVSKNASIKRSTDYINMGPVYPMDQFIVNLLSDSGSRFLKTKVELELNAEALTPEIDKKKPLIRDIIVRTLSSKTFEEVSTIKGKDRLKDEIVDRINEVLADGHLKNIYFTDFVVQ
ncbi:MULTISPECIES: flagellar basal body-associated protein FliL [unclassified Campylobacter]|uniref:flagellar basal body-associated protein FliL n=1 Tax=Campylobacter TaxID=194 RepID=UPI0014751E17|nr:MULTISPECIES: flagellar basal body-associated protein FliL [unclassified Campylobacter]